MPPEDSKQSLTEREIELIRRWISQGAQWTDHWSFEPLSPVDVPEFDAGLRNAPIRDQSNQWARNEIDRFVAKKMRQHDLHPGEHADRQALIRRLYFDLTGLPPTLEEVDAFVSAKDEASAYEQCVDRLLQSPHYGERMASEWLDVARYSDTYGYQVDRDRFVWPWRDWVINAFNRNLAYDQFITQQLAGDLLSDSTPDKILATTFNRLHPQKVEGGSTPEEFRIEYVADRTQTFATAFLGLTLECARCHDHKYDPLAQREYYQLSAFFDQIDEAGLYSYFTESIPTPTMLLHNEQSKDDLEAAEQRIAEAEQALADRHEQPNEAFDQWLRGDRTLHSPSLHQSSGRQSVERPSVALGENTAKSESNDESTSDDAVPEPAVEPHPLIPGRVWISEFESEPKGENKLVSGVIGKAIKLTGDDRFKTGVGNFTRNQPFSVSLWMQTPDVKKRSVVFHRTRAWTDAASRGYELLLEDGRLSFALVHFWPGNAIRAKALDPIETGRWNHVAITYDGSSRADGITIYVDGRKIAVELVRDKLTKKITGGGFDEIMIGERFRDRGFTNGLVDEFQVFARQLTPIEVAQLHDDKSFIELQRKPSEQLTPQERTKLKEAYLACVDTDYTAQLSQLQDLRMQRSEIVESLKEIMVMDERDGQRQTFVLNRGAYDQRRELVEPATPAAFNEFPSDRPRNRLGLARWLTDASNPLTARVAVNRYWQMVFGEGLVRTPEDFGSQGRPPTHPELLDWLANDFVSNGWDVKRLMKQLVMSATYQQSTQVSDEVRRLDPENLWLTHAQSFRLPAEMLRDNALFVGGLLLDKIGGAPAKPYDLEVSFKPSTPDPGSGVYRRSVYTYWKRTGPAPAMMTLDAAKRDVCRVKRERTSSPLQALVLLNGPQFVEAARGLAQELIARHDSATDTILNDTFRTLTGRRPNATQMAVIRDLYDRQLSYFANNKAERDHYLSVGRLARRASIDATRLAATAAVANSLMNYDGSLTKP